MDFVSFSFQYVSNNFGELFIYFHMIRYQLMMNPGRIYGLFYRFPQEEHSHGHLKNKEMRFIATLRCTKAYQTMLQTFRNRQYIYSYAEAKFLCVLVRVHEAQGVHKSCT